MSSKLLIIIQNQNELSRHFSRNFKVIISTTLTIKYAVFVEF